MNNKKAFDYSSFEHEAIKQFQAWTPLSGNNGVHAPLLKRLLETGLHGELSGHLKEYKAVYPAVSNRRNGLMRKHVKTDYGSMDVCTPRDRERSFEPKILPKRQTVLGEEMYQLQLSPSSITAITDSIMPEIAQWQTRPQSRLFTIFCYTKYFRIFDAVTRAC